MRRREGEGTDQRSGEVGAAYAAHTFGTCRSRGWQVGGFQWAGVFLPVGGGCFFFLPFFVAGRLAILSLSLSLFLSVSFSASPFVCVL